MHETVDALFDLKLYV